MTLFLEVPDYMQTIYNVMNNNEDEPGIQLAGSCVLGKTFQFALKVEGVGESLESVMTYMNDNINEWKQCGQALWTLWILLQGSKDNRIKAKKSGGLALLVKVKRSHQINTYFPQLKPFQAVLTQMELWMQAS